MNVIVPVGKNYGAYRDLVADDPACGMTRTVHLGRDVFNDDAAAAVRWLHRANPSAIEACSRTALSAIAVAVTGRETPEPAGGIALAADGSIRSRLLQETA